MKIIYRCKFCKREIYTEEERYYKICDKCYYGMRLDPEDWLKWLRSIGEDAVRVSVGHFVPKEEWYEGIDRDRLNSLYKLIKEEKGENDGDKKCKSCN